MGRMEFWKVLALPGQLRPRDRLELAALTHVMQASPACQSGQPLGPTTANEETVGLNFPTRCTTAPGGDMFRLETRQVRPTQNFERFQGPEQVPA